MKLDDPLNRISLHHARQSGNAGRIPDFCRITSNTAGLIHPLAAIAYQESAAFRQFSLFSKQSLKKIIERF
ncbi:MAG: hypothetical protein PHG00_02095 [Methylococcales bacterium]|nr:hypothetical protein [Methylococcales bacterium]